MAERTRLLAELHRDSLYPMMGRDTWVAGADCGEAPGPKPVRLGRRLRLRRQPPGYLAALEWWRSARSLTIFPEFAAGAIERLAPGGDTARGFADTAMQLAHQKMLPEALAAVVRAMSAARSLVAFEHGAIGPSKDCAYEGPVIKALPAVRSRWKANRPPAPISVRWATLPPPCATSRATSRSRTFGRSRATHRKPMRRRWPTIAVS